MTTTKIISTAAHLPEMLANKAQWAWRGAVKGFGGKRLPRYFWLVIVGLIVIWTIAIAYIVFTPRSYESGFTFVLPGSGAGASINLEQIGQASSISQSPFSNQRVNPTESYKRLLLSDRVRDAAKAWGDFDSLPRPRVKLHDQTQFMEITIQAATPKLAHKRAEAYEKAFLGEVDLLRLEERKAREAGYQAMIAEFETGVSQARAALLMHQSSSGLASLAQFNENVALVDNLNTSLNEARIAETELARKRDSLLASINLTHQDASQALLLAADPAFLVLADAHAEREVLLSQTAFKFGENHPQRVKQMREHHGLTDELAARAHRFTDIPREKAMRFARLLSSAEYSALLKTAIEGEAAYEAARQRSEQLAATLDAERMRLKSLSVAAAKLDDLNRAHQVAEAVFRSAMARIDTNKTDLFASYPLIQTVEAPFTPHKPATPMLALGLVGAIAASMLYVMGLALACLRLPILNALMKSS